jgi:membrane-associated phospholipid phosphatase
VSLIRGFLAPALGVLILPSTALAQFRADSAKRDIQHLIGDVWSVWTSPAHAHARGFAGAGAALGVAALASVGDEPLHRWMTDHRDSWPMRLLHPMTEEARYPAYEMGSGQYILPLSAALYLAGTAGRSRNLRDAGLGCATAHLTSAGARDIVYLLVQRERPRDSPDDPFHFRFPGASGWNYREWNWHSFFSGHIANSMGCASFLAHRFHLHAAEPLVYTFVSAIGLGRVIDGRHWLSDTVVGAEFGYVVGRTVSARTLQRERRAPSPAAVPLALSFSWQFE